MALQGTKVTKDAVNHTSAYAMINMVTINKKDSVARIDVEIYHSKATRDALAYPVETKEYFVRDTSVTTEDMNGEEVVTVDNAYTKLFNVSELDKVSKNTISQSYTFLASHDDFSGYTTA